MVCFTFLKMMMFVFNGVIFVSIEDGIVTLGGWVSSNGASGSSASLQKSLHHRIFSVLLRDVR